MFFNKRKKWNSQVASLMPTFGLDIQQMGVMSALESLDLVYPKGFSPQEAALYLAYVTYNSLLSKGALDAAAVVGKRIPDAENEWVKLHLVNPRNPKAWREKARLLEEQAGATARLP
ncbi:MAG: hypothetical protein RI553_05900 [Salibaculum sp.]|uniref:hypothetical protein n=2 Tax=Salibaculum sp. TaxID=2855480 RepID=UPI0028708D39|nr:hypothetical protein [Salibaculum sp.]MDR9427629.1 hypothetical protein [Salibaculum sp.]